MCKISCSADKNNCIKWICWPDYLTIDEWQKIKDNNKANSPFWNCIIPTDSFEQWHTNGCPQVHIYVLHGHDLLLDFIGFSDQPESLWATNNWVPTIGSFMLFTCTDVCVCCADHDQLCLNWNRPGHLCCKLVGICLCNIITQRWPTRQQLWMCWKLKQHLLCKDLDTVFKSPISYKLADTCEIPVVQ